MVRFRFRYSLRSLLVAIALAAVVMYWFTLPSMTAYRLERQLRSGEAASVTLFFNGKSMPLSDFGNQDQLSRTTIILEPLTWQGFLRSERYIYLHVPYGKKMGEFDWDVTIRARPGWLDILLYMH